MKTLILVIAALIFQNSASAQEAQAIELPRTKMFQGTASTELYTAFDNPGYLEDSYRTAIGMAKNAAIEDCLKDGSIDTNVCLSSAEKYRVIAKPVSTVRKLACGPLPESLFGCPKETVHGYEIRVVFGVSE